MPNEWSKSYNVTYYVAIPEILFENFFKVAKIYHSFLVRALQCKKSKKIKTSKQITLRTNWYSENLFFGIEKCQCHLLAILNLFVGPSHREVRYWWRLKQSEFFHESRKLSTEIERFSATEQEKCYNHIIIFNI